MLEHDAQHCRPTVWKNLGLAYARITQSKITISPDAPWPLAPALQASGMPWGAVAAARCLDVWRTFVNKPEAKSVDGYENIKNVVHVLEQAEAKSLAGKAAAAPPAAVAAPEGASAK